MTALETTSLGESTAALQAESEPNVLLVILDDIGLDYFFPGYLEGEGFDKAPMPTIEGLMDDGFVFDNLQTYATCSPTRASLLAGKHADYSLWDKTTNRASTTSTTYSTTEFTDDAIDWIADQDGQWFTWLAYTAPHTPLHLPPTDLHSIDALSGDENDIRRNSDQYFAAMLESVDTEIGQLRYGTPKTSSHLTAVSRPLLP